MRRQFVIGLQLGLGLCALAMPIAAQPPLPAKHAADLARHEQLQRLGVHRWHELGDRGQGVKIAVLDTGFRGWRDHLGNGLPRQVTARSFRADGDLEARDSQHGILCAEILHSIAPDAELLLANWDTEAPASFLQAVRWAKQKGARVLTCSVVMPTWSDGEGGGAVHAALDELLGDELLLFACAGNVAQRHWTGPPQPDEHGWHQWRTGVVANRVEPWGNDRVAVELYGPPACAGVLLLADASSGEWLEQAPCSGTSGAQKDWRQAVVRFDPKPGRRYEVCLKWAADARADVNAKFHLVVLGGNLAHGMASGSIPFPADGARVVAVGAVDHHGRRAPYSSCGPNSRLPKPDFVATVPFASRCRPQPFSGTSAAAPQAAALAALWWSRNPSWNAPRVKSALRDAAVDLGPDGHDWETGHGLIRLP